MTTLPPTLVSAKEDDKPFKNEEEPIEEDKQYYERFSGETSDKSPYPDSSSHDDPTEHVESQEEDTSKSNVSLEIVTPLPPSSGQSFSIRELGPRMICTPRKYIPILSRKRAISLPSSSRTLKKSYPTQSGLLR
ncbi:unnamed protein product [Lactuca saligna]|uniref:Uncharacterized protein n=1 Tax=Lactuca saligna TaxID=75948 RepID=A0AA35Z3Z5_LACSI|nr:unnamed protein product [Lactuca saligna]